MRRVAALDCGTNTLRLLVADLDPGSSDLVPVERRTTIVRLGQDVDRTGVFADAALARTFAVLDDYREVIEAHHVQARRFVATSAARDVRNRQVFVDGVRARLGIAPDIVSGDEEARLAYDGATRQLRGRSDVATPILVMDIGGGSTELVMRLGDGAAVRGVSLDVGSVRLTERHLHGDPPTTGEIAAAVADVNAALDTVDLPVGSAATLVGLAGSVTTMAAIVLGLEVYERDRINLAVLSRVDVERAVARVVSMTVAERRMLAVMHPDRADVIGAGAIILGCVLDRVALPELVVSEQDILDGIAWSMI